MTLTLGIAFAIGLLVVVGLATSNDMKHYNSWHVNRNKNIRK